MVIALSDNGASAEGGLEGTFNETLFFNKAPETLEDNLAHYDHWGSVETFPHYSWGWTHAGATPFRRWKRETYRGGISDPFIVFWPEKIKNGGELRTQYCHAIDLAPTVLAACGVAAPEVIDGVGGVGHAGGLGAMTHIDRSRWPMLPVPCWGRLGGA